MITKLEHLIVTVDQNDFSLIDKMNVKADAVIANQSNGFGYEEKTINGRKIKLVTTNTKGISINRNIALMFAENDILLCSDDDMCYSDDYEKKILEAFSELPQADVIIFSVDVMRKGVLSQDNFRKTKRLHMTNCLKYGTYRIAFRKKSILASNIHFSHVLAMPAFYKMGEDSLFLVDCFKNRLKIYHHKHLIGVTSKDSSSWYTGMDEQYFFDKGAMIYALFYRFRIIFFIYFILRTKSDKNVSSLSKWKLMYNGYKNYSELINFNDWKRHEG